MRACGNALAATDTFLAVDYGTIVGDGDGIHRAVVGAGIAIGAVAGNHFRKIAAVHDFFAFGSFEAADKMQLRNYLL